MGRRHLAGDYIGGVPVTEYLEFFAAAYRLPRKRWRGVVDDVMTLCDLGGIRAKLVETLSKGMRQRLCLAKTLIHDPKVLILDEPAEGLDPRARIELRELLKELGRMGKTVLISSHILTELSDLCSWVGIIEKGRLLASAGWRLLQVVKASAGPVPPAAQWTLLWAGLLGGLVLALPWILLFACESPETSRRVARIAARRARIPFAGWLLPGPARGAAWAGLVGVLFLALLLAVVQSEFPGAFGAIPRASALEGLALLASFLVFACGAGCFLATCLSPLKARLVLLGILGFLACAPPFLWAAHDGAWTPVETPFHERLRPPPAWSGAFAGPAVAAASWAAHAEADRLFLAESRRMAQGIVQQFQQMQAQARPGRPKVTGYEQHVARWRAEAARVEYPRVEAFKRCSLARGEPLHRWSVLWFAGTGLLLAAWGARRLRARALAAT